MSKAEGEGPVMKGQETISYKRSFLIGMILGDAFVRQRAKHRLTVEWTISHCEKYADLVEWKRNEFVRLFGIQPPVIHTSPNGEGVKHLFSFTTGKRIRIVSQWFSKNRRRHLSPKIRFMDHPVGLAMLLCDDGSVRRRKKIHRDGSIYYLKPSFTIATHSFSLEEVNRLLGHISVTFGINGIINPERRWRKGERREYYRSHFNVENSRRLWQSVLPYLPRIPSIRAKFAYAYDCFGCGTADTHTLFGMGEDIVQTTNSPGFMAEQ
ncbi:MAG: hypothetical protein COX40_00160 [Candidatus Omnitrophica bacterium CG23_combo_of_CG06-09_8_20_14_all_40_11]|nr:MAG: hypothetical protein COX40_00160 [Candidatus Omnitrophica bacterium CG23_combo_of_CG06-09_8_20_14_all_40_11]